MKKVILTFIAVLLLTCNVYAIELGDNANLDMVVKYQYVVKDVGEESLDTNTVRVFGDIDPNYVLTGEVGVKLFDAVRISGKYDYVEHFEERYGGGVEVYLPINIVDVGVVADVLWINDNINNRESEPIPTVGLVARFE